LLKRGSATRLDMDVCAGGIPCRPGPEIRLPPMRVRGDIRRERRDAGMARRLIGRSIAAPSKSEAQR
jgi:hypothetical protein